MLKSVQILFPIAGYAVNEIVGLEAEIALRLVSRGVAKLYVAPESQTGPQDFHRDLPVHEDDKALMAPSFHTALFAPPVMRDMPETTKARTGKRGA